MRPPRLALSLDRTSRIARQPQLRSLGKIRRLQEQKITFGEMLYAWELEGKPDENDGPHRCHEFITPYTQHRIRAEFHGRKSPQLGIRAFQLGTQLN